MKNSGNFPLIIDKEIKSFSIKMKEAIGYPFVIFFIVVILFRFFPIPESIINAIGQGLPIILWLYPFLILFQFYRYTKLKEYIIQFHTSWLSLCIAYPLGCLIAYLIIPVGDLLGASLKQYDYLEVIFVLECILLVVSYISKGLRKKKMEAEVLNNLDLWRQLSALRRRDIMLMRFSRADNEFNISEK